ncbi:MAG TPA: aromatic amino acid ammonia-lyase [Oligoflexus sp.]|uniref:aromatic amino acid ammonia-lyase n=1 Tax=Oligoflexus sp. TaxID=1971216 RepID=UPI002D7F898A|nr:aromatic amino acid ammonia-lyase [Oligoflexus sp.]HET9240727.1 aromatic amino acid ammonia-lyase [Oligoflexus sp.]
MPLHLHHQTGLADLLALGEAKTGWTLDDDAADRVKTAHDRLLQLIESGEATVYGLHTHFGHNLSTRVPLEDWQTHQKALLLYLCVGVGPALPERVVRRALRLQAHKMGLGFSGLHPRTFQKLLQLADAPSLPSVPSLGSLGASGDLIPMAHAVAPLFTDHKPEGPRDVLALVNTNAMMASLAVEIWHDLMGLKKAAGYGWLLHAEGLGWQRQGHAHAGWQTGNQFSVVQQQWFDQVRDWQKELEQKRSGHAKKPSVLQERYSIRCAPQIFLDIEDNLHFAGEKIQREALKLADNPIVREDGIWHGGLFYTAALASAAELMQNAIVRLADMMDRQILLTVTPETNHGLPENLSTQEPGNHVKGLHQLASAVLQKIKGMSLPASLLSFSCESNNQDVVPASMSSLLLVRESLELLGEVTRIHRFIGERAFYQRQGQALPPELNLAQFPAFRLR